MIKQAHNITIKVYAYEDENAKQIAQALTQLLPEQFEEEKIFIETEDIRILEGRDMSIYTVSLQKQRHIKETLTLLKEHLGAEQCAIIAQQENRVDDEGNCFIRIDKQSFVETGQVKLTDAGDCFHIKLVLAAFPKSKENAVRVMKELFG